MYTGVEEGNLYKDSADGINYGGEAWQTEHYIDSENEKTPLLSMVIMGLLLILMHRRRGWLKLHSVLPFRFMTWKGTDRPLAGKNRPLYA